jgi:hypothetical protein
MNIQDAVMGTDNPRDLLLAAGVQAFRVQAGYQAQTGVFVDDPQGAAIEYAYSGYSAELLHALSKFTKDYAWIAGGSVLHFIHNEKVGYGDIDVFCVSESAYATLKDCFSSYLVSESKRSCVVKDGMFELAENSRYRLERNLNLVSPVDGQDWSHPATVLQEFDLSVAAVAIIEPGLAYTLHKDDVLKKEMNYIGNCRNPVKFWRRVMKYYNRGCSFGFDFFTQLIQDEHTRELVYMAQDMYDMNSHKQNINPEFLSACWAINDYEGYEDTSDSTDNEPDYDGWY